MFIEMTPFLEFDRQQWSLLRKSIPLKLTEQDLKPLLGINEELSLEEVKNIYLPLTRLINYYIDADFSRHAVINNFLGNEKKNVPYIIGIAGSVAVGKSTTARILQSLLSNWPNPRKVDLVTTDGFLYPLDILMKKNILDKKGFPISYDLPKLIKFVSDIKSGKPNISAPIYSHITYDIIKGEEQVVDQPDILILEGLNVLQPQRSLQSNTMFVSDFVDFSIFVDAREELLIDWFVQRFLKLMDSVFANPNSYFYKYSSLEKEEAINLATKIWHQINGKNLRENILPTKARADLIFEKGVDHTIHKISLRK